MADLEEDLYETRALVDLTIPVDDDLDESTDDEHAHEVPADLLNLYIDLEEADVTPEQFKEWADAAAAE